MRATWKAIHRPGRGFSLIGLLLVVVILFFLAGYYFQGDEENPGVTGYLEKEKQAISVYQSSIGRARDVAQGENLRALQGNIDQWCVSHPNEPCTLEKLLAAAIPIPAPPAGFRWEIDPTNQARMVEAQQNAPPLAPGADAPPPLPNVGK